MKQGIRIIGFAGGPIERGKKGGKALVVGLVWREGIIEGLVSTMINVDGSDATGAITKLIKTSRFSDQVKLIALNGVALAGLNVVDVKNLKDSTGCEAIIVTRKRQRHAELIKAISKNERNAKTRNRKIKLVKWQAGLKLKKSNDFHYRSTSEAIPSSLVSQSAEALRISHIIARGIATGESKGRI